MYLRITTYIRIKTTSQWYQNYISKVLEVSEIKAVQWQVLNSKVPPSMNKMNKNLSSLSKVVAVKK